MDSYEAPTIADYGDLLELTAAVAPTGCEDGTAKDGSFSGPGVCVGPLP